MVPRTVLPLGHCKSEVGSHVVSSECTQNLQEKEAGSPENEDYDNEDYDILGSMFRV